MLGKISTKRTLHEEDNSIRAIISITKHWESKQNPNTVIIFKFRLQP